MTHLIPITGPAGGAGRARPELLVQDALAKLMLGRTTFVVAEPA